MRAVPTFGVALACVALAACGVEPTVSGDCDALVFEGTAQFPRDDTDVLVALDATGRVPLAAQADLVFRFLRQTVDGVRDPDGVPTGLNTTPFSDVHVAFVTGGVGPTCDAAAAIPFSACGDEPFVAYGKYGTPPRPTLAQVEAALRCAIALPRPPCATSQPFEAAARALDAERASPTGFRRDGAELTVVSVGGPGACDGPTGMLTDRALWALFDSEGPRPQLGRMCTEADAVAVKDGWLIRGGEELIGVCLPRDVQRDERGVPACDVDETIGWPDDGACAALSPQGRDPIPVGFDARGHAICRLHPLALDPAGLVPAVGEGFYVLDATYVETLAMCRGSGAAVRFTFPAEPLPGSTVRVHCVADSSVCR